jgi:serine/threonine protein kinase
MPGIRRKRGCLCCKRPYDGVRPHAMSRLADDELSVNADHLDHDLDQSFNMMGAGFYDFLQNIHKTEPPSRLQPNMAKQVAGIAKARAREAARCQSPGERQANLPLMAPFPMDEIELGRLLGVGGFSNVYAIVALDARSSKFVTASCTTTTSTTTSKFGNTTISSTNTNTDNKRMEKIYTKEQRIAREFLSQHCLRSQGESSNREIRKERLVDEAEDSSKHKQHQEKEQPSFSSSSNNNKNSSMSRYALKHLRPSLIHTPERFVKAAMDLACEAEMMLCLDHPHICKIRGWADGGPGAYKSGAHDAYFLIIDRLLETLQDRIWYWRKTWILRRRQECRERNGIVQLLGCLRIQNCLPSSSSRRKRDEAAASSCSPPEEEDEEEAVDVLLVERLKVAYEISSALEHLHERRIIYRDLKAANVGFDIRGDVKIFDFGLSRFLPTSRTGDLEESYRMSNVGTRRYTAPEVMENKPYNLKADIYTFGVVLWEVLTMSSPPSGPKKKRGKKRSEPIGKGGQPCRLAPCPCWPTDLQTLVSSMLNPDYTKRPTILHVRTAIKDLLMKISDSETSDEILHDEAFSRRRRSTFRLDSFDMETLGLKDLDDDPNRQSHTSVCTSFSI